MKFSRWHFWNSVTLKAGAALVIALLTVTLIARLHSVAYLSVFGSALLVGMAYESLRQRRPREIVAFDFFRDLQQNGLCSLFRWDLGQDRLVWVRRPDFLADDRSFHAWGPWIHPEDRNSALAAFRDIAGGAANADVEFRVLMADGSSRYLLLRAFPYRVSRWQQGCIAGVLIEITARCKNEEFVREAALEVVVSDLASHLGDAINNSLDALTNTVYLLQHDSQLQPAMRQFLLDTAAVELSRLGKVSRNCLGLDPKIPGDDLCHSTFPLMLGGKLGS